MNFFIKNWVPRWLTGYKVNHYFPCMRVVVFEFFIFFVCPYHQENQYQNFTCPLENAYYFLKSWQEQGQPETRLLL